MAGLLGNWETDGGNDAEQDEQSTSFESGSFVPTAETDSLGHFDSQETGQGYHIQSEFADAFGERGETIRFSSRSGARPPSPPSTHVTRTTSGETRTTYTTSTTTTSHNSSSHGMLESPQASFTTISRTGNGADGDDQGWHVAGDGTATTRSTTTTFDSTDPATSSFVTRTFSSSSNSQPGTYTVRTQSGSWQTGDGAGATRFFSSSAAADDRQRNVINDSSTFSSTGLQGREHTNTSSSQQQDTTASRSRSGSGFWTGGAGGDNASRHDDTEDSTGYHSLSTSRTGSFYTLSDAADGPGDYQSYVVTTENDNDDGRPFTPSAAQRDFRALGAESSTFDDDSGLVTPRRDLSGSLTQSTLLAHEAGQRTPRMGESQEAFTSQTQSASFADSPTSRFTGENTRQQIGDDMSSSVIYSPTGYQQGESSSLSTTQSTGQGYLNETGTVRRRPADDAVQFEQDNASYGQTVSGSQSAANRDAGPSAALDSVTSQIAQSYSTNSAAGSGLLGAVGALGATNVAERQSGSGQDRNVSTSRSQENADAQRSTTSAQIQQQYSQNDVARPTTSVSTTQGQGMAVGQGFDSTQQMRASAQDYDVQQGQSKGPVVIAQPTTDASTSISGSQTQPRSQQSDFGTSTSAAQSKQTSGAQQSSYQIGQAPQTTSSGQVLGSTYSQQQPLSQGSAQYGAAAGIVGGAAAGAAAGAVADSRAQTKSSAQQYPTGASDLRGSVGSAQQYPTGATDLRDSTGRAQQSSAGTTDTRGFTGGAYQSSTGAAGVQGFAADAQQSATGAAGVQGSTAGAQQSSTGAAGVRGFTDRAQQSTAGTADTRGFTGGAQQSSTGAAGVRGSAADAQQSSTGVAGIRGSAAGPQQSSTGAAGVQGSTAGAQQSSARSTGVDGTASASQQGSTGAADVRGSADGVQRYSAGTRDNRASAGGFQQTSGGQGATAGVSSQTSDQGYSSRSTENQKPMSASQSTQYSSLNTIEGGVSRQNKDNALTSGAGGLDSSSRTASGQAGSTSNDALSRSATQKRVSQDLSSSSAGGITGASRSTTGMDTQQAQVSTADGSRRGEKIEDPARASGYNTSRDAAGVAAGAAIAGAAAGSALSGRTGQQQGISSTTVDSSRNAGIAGATDAATSTTSKDNVGAVSNRSGAGVNQSSNTDRTSSTHGLQTTSAVAAGQGNQASEQAARRSAQTAASNVTADRGTTSTKEATKQATQATQARTRDNASATAATTAATSGITTNDSKARTGDGRNASTAVSGATGTNEDGRAAQRASQTNTRSREEAALAAAAAAATGGTLAADASTHAGRQQGAAAAGAAANSNQAKQAGITTGSSQAAAPKGGVVGAVNGSTNAKQAGISKPTSPATAQTGIGATAADTQAAKSTGATRSVASSPKQQNAAVVVPDSKSTRQATTTNRTSQATAPQAVASKQTSSTVRPGSTTGAGTANTSPSDKQPTTFAERWQAAGQRQAGLADRSSQATQQDRTAGRDNTALAGGLVAGGAAGAAVSYLSTAPLIGAASASGAGGSSGFATQSGTQAGATGTSALGQTSANTAQYGVNGASGSAGNVGGATQSGMAGTSAAKPSGTAAQYSVNGTSGSTGATRNVAQHGAAGTSGTTGTSTDATKSGLVATSSTADQTGARGATAQSQGPGAYGSAAALGAAGALGVAAAETQDEAQTRNDYNSYNSYLSHGREIAEPTDIGASDAHDDGPVSPSEGFAPVKASGKEKLDGFGSRRSSTKGELTEDELVRYMSQRNTSVDGTLSRASTTTDAEEQAEINRLMSRMFGRTRQEQSEEEKTRHVGVVFKHLTVKGMGLGAALQPTTGDVFLGLPRFLKNLVLKGPRRAAGKPPIKTIINDFSGVIKPGEMCLVLGRPGSGCSTFLKVLGNQRFGYESIEGEVTYGGTDAHTMLKRYRGEVSYNPEEDLHYATLSVKRTLEFALKCKTPGKEGRNEGESASQYVANFLRAVVKLFWIEHTLGTKVGNEYVRGVSGGEKKRVSIAEAMITKASIQCWDNSTRGLDASTALEYVSSIRSLTNMAHISTAVALYQAGENLYKRFDKVLLIDGGRCAYFGDADVAAKYFKDLGFVQPERWTTADFLTSVTDEHERHIRQGWENRIPRTADEFGDAFRRSKQYQTNLQEIEAFEQEVKVMVEERHRAQGKSTKRKNYTISFWRQIIACTHRQFLVMIGDRQTLIGKWGGILFQSLIIGSLFYNLGKTSEYVFPRGGVLFFMLLFNALLALAELTSAFQSRPILLKHKSFQFYRPAAFAIAQTFVDVPLVLVQVVIFDVVVYFMANLSRTASQFFTSLLFLFFLTMTMYAFFRAIGSLVGSLDAATRITGVAIQAIVVYTGYLIPPTKMHPWFSWIRWINPIQYGFEALMANEFHKLTIDCVSPNLVPSGNGVVSGHQGCTIQGSAPDSTTVSGAAYIETAYRYTYAHIWRNLGIIIAFFIFFVFVTAVGMELQKPNKGGGAVTIYKRGQVPKSFESAMETGKLPDDVEKRGGDQMAADSNRFTEKDHQDTSGSESEEAVKGVAGNDTVFTWQNVNYTIPFQKGQRQLLKDVQGYVRPGKLTALMGASGAGKTTLLNTLAQRINFGRVDGTFLVDGWPLPKSFQRSSGFAEQMDVHEPTATVREALRFSALLRQPREVSTKEKYEYCETILKLLEMEDIAGATVGIPGSGLNQEQRKRLTIGVELASKPELLMFLDEPTSGLDSQSAFNIVRLLRKLAAAGQAILCTIHQPSAVLFQEFDDLVLLKSGGRIVYHGELGRDSRTMIEYFESNGGKKCPTKANPAEYMLEVIGAGDPDYDGPDWGDTWAHSHEKESRTREIEELIQQRRSATKESSFNDDREYAMVWWVQIYVVVYRNFVAYWRSPNYLIGKFLLHIITGLFNTFTFWHLGHSSIDMQSRLFSIFMTLTIAPPLIQQLQPRFLKLRAIYESRERNSKIYGWYAFVWAAILPELPYSFLAGTIYCKFPTELPPRSSLLLAGFTEAMRCCWYWATWFPRDTYTSASVWLFVCLFEMFYVSLGQAIASFAPNELLASILVPMFFLFVVSFCGVIVPYAALPYFWRSWMYDLTPFRYLLEGLLGLIVHNVQVQCDTNEYAMFTAPPGQNCGGYAGTYANNSGGYVITLNTTTQLCGFCQYRTGDDFAKSFNVYYGHVWRDYGIFYAYVVFNFSVIFFASYMYLVGGRKLMRWIRSRKK